MQIKFKSIGLFVVLIIAVVCNERSMRADIVLTQIGVAVTDTFDEYRGSGFSPGAAPSTGRLDSNTYRARGFSDGDGAFGGTHTTGDFARGTSTGGVDDADSGAYSFEVATGDYATGVQPSDFDFNPGTFTIRVANQTGQGITGVRISGNANFYNDQDRSTRWIFAGSLNDADYVPFFTINSPEQKDGAPVWTEILLDDYFPFPFELPNNTQFFVQIIGQDLSGTGQRDEFALSSISFTAVPEPTGTGILTMVLSAALMRRKRNRLS